MKKHVHFRKLRYRYLAVLSTIGIISLAGYYILETTIRTQETTAQEINMAGRQRMLSQKVVLLISQSYTTESETIRSGAIEELKETIELMRHSNLALTKGSPVLGMSPPASQELRGMYFGPSGVDAEIGEFLKSADMYINGGISSSQYLDQIGLEAAHILGELDKITNQYGIESRSRIADVQQKQTLLLAAMLIVLIGSGMLGLEPMIMKLDAHLKERRENEAVIQRANKAVELQQKIAATANEAVDSDELMQMCVDLVCEYTGWAIGHVYKFDKDRGDMYPSNIWCINAPGGFQHFRKITGETRCLSGIGLPGRVLAEGEPVWSADTSEGGNSLRYKEGIDVGLKAASAFPIKVEGSIVAVMEFFSTDTKEPVSSLFELMDHVGNQIGLNVARESSRRTLAQNEQKLRSVINSSNETAVLSINGEGKLLTWNPGAEKTFGYTEDEIKGRQLTSLIPERYREAHRAGLSRASNSEDYHVIGTTVELAGLHKDGHEFPLELALGVWEDDGQKYFSAIIHDITERKQADDLLISTREEAIASNKAKSEFLASMSHELRTPLNAILGFSGMMSNQYLGPLGNDRYVEYAEDITSSGKHLLELVDDILSIEQIECGKQELEITSVDVVKVIYDCEKLLCSKADEKGISMRITVADDLQPLLADRRALLQILTNLLTNAIKFSKDDKEVELSVTNSAAHHRFEVKDAGVGIPEDRIATLTEPFTRHNPDPHKFQEGVGLGLSICNSLIESHGGELMIESEVGVGTVVVVTLPSGSG
jgi:PAS domain S-box-containing protein